MLAELKHTLRRLRGQTIVWGMSLFLFGLLMAYFYSTMASMDGIMEMIESYPEELLAFFGDVWSLNTPQGYLDTYYFSMMTLILGVLAIGACASLVVGDEEKGILDLVMAHPISRTSLFWGRLLGFTIAMAIVHILGWLGWVVSSGSSGLDLTWIEFLRPFRSKAVELGLSARIGDVPISHDEPPLLHPSESRIQGALLHLKRLR